MEKLDVLNDTLVTEGNALVNQISDAVSEVPSHTSLSQHAHIFASLKAKDMLADGLDEVTK
jgi:hypothetical protein